MGERATPPRVPISSISIASVAVIALTSLGCGARSTLEQNDASASGDAEVGTESFPRCTDSASLGVAAVHGYALELDESCKAVFPGVTADVCWLDHPDHCTKNDLLGAYHLEDLPNQELVLRMSSPASVPRLLPLHPYDCDFGSLFFLVPTRDAWAKILAPFGGMDARRSILLVYAERKPTGVPSASPCAGGASGFAVSASRGSVYYADATGMAIDPTLHATSVSGLAMILADPGDPVRVVAAKPGAGTHCKMTKGFGFRRGDVNDLSQFQTDAPALAGHVTYALYTQCTGP